MTATMDTMGLSGVLSESLRQEDRLKIALVGEPKVGKSWLAATAPKPIRIFDFDDRAESLAGKEGLLIARKPTMQQVETDLSITKARKIKNQPIPATWVFDSVTYMQREMESEIFRQAPDLARKIKVGPSNIMQIRNSWDVINGVQRYLEYLIAEFAPLGNIVFVFHEKSEKDYTKSTAKETVYTGESTVDPQFLAKSLSLFNEVWRVKLDHRNQYEVQVKPQWDFKASTTMLLSENEKPDILKMIEKHHENMKEKK